jgi:hypothetical protein
LYIYIYIHKQNLKIALKITEKEIKYYKMNKFKIAAAKVKKIETKIYAGRYEIVEKIGEGSQAVAFKVKDLGNFGQM